MTSRVTRTDLHHPGTPVTLPELIGWRGILCPALLLGSLACSEIGAPDRGDGAIRLGLRLEYALSGQTLDVLPHYRRTDESTVTLLVQQIALEDAESQTIEVEIGLGSCLADPNREAGGTGCPLRIALVLRNELAELLDSTLVGPLAATPGASLSVPEVTLRQVERIILSAASDSVAVGGTLTVNALVQDRAGTKLTDRELVWSSSNPAVATVSSTGVVSGLRPGPVTITARLAGRTSGPMGSLALTVRGGSGVIGAQGGTVYSRDGELALAIPAGALTGPTTITVRPAALAGTPTRVVSGTAFDLQPDGLQFRQPATLTIRYLPATIPGGLSNEQSLRLVNLVSDSVPVRVEGSVVNTADHSVSGPIDHLSTYLAWVALVGVRSLSVGDNHACAVLQSGVAVCGGSNTQGQLGDGTTDPGTDNIVAGGQAFASVSAGGLFSCGLTFGGQVFCWGDNYFGQLGVGSITDATTPQLVSLPTLAVSIELGYDFACAADQNRLVQCWGSNLRGQLGVVTQSTCNGVSCARTPLVVGPAAPSGTRRLSSGLAHRCELSSLQVACVGWNAFGQLGLPPGDPAQSSAFVPVALGESDFPFVRLYAGNAMTCGLDEIGTAFCWGGNFFGSKGDGTTNSPASSSVVPVTGGLRFAMLAPARANSTASPSCGVTTSGDGYCWGSNFNGVLGTTASLSTCSLGFNDLTAGCTGTPVRVAGGLKFKEIYSGTALTCGRTTADEIWCWGTRPDGTVALVPELVP